MTAVLGFLVAVIDVTQFLPQARRAIRQGTHGVSIWTWSLATFQGVIWVVYGFAEKLYAVAIPNLVIAPTCALILFLTVRHRRQSSTT